MTDHLRLVHGGSMDDDGGGGWYDDGIDDGITPPQSARAEAEVLATGYTFPELWPEIAAALTASDFASPARRLLFAAMAQCYEDTQALDMVLIQQRLEDAGELEQVGGTDTLLALLDRSGTTTSLRHYLAVVKRKALSRNFLACSSALAGLARRSELSADALISGAEAAVRDAARGVSEIRVITAGEGVAEYQRRMEEARQHGGIVGIRSGIDDLDRITRGLRGGWHVVVLGNPGDGKTALAVGNFAAEALRAGLGVLDLRYEMSAAEIMGRLIAGECGVPTHVQESATISAADLSALEDGISFVRGYPMHILERPKLTAARLVAERLKAGPGLGLVVLDYLQLAAGAVDMGPRASDEQRLSHVARWCKELAGDLDVPVISLSQPDKASSTAGRLTASSGKGAQEIEASADVILIPYRPHKADNDPARKRIADITVAKHRHGEPGRVPDTEVRWNGARMRFERHTAGGGFTAGMDRSW